MADITLEGANTSFQVHYKVSPRDYADTFNAIQLMTPLALAIGANSPTLFGHRLWHETRIPLFKQSIDTRRVDRYGWNEPARVNFGQGWVRRGALELFTEVVGSIPRCCQSAPLWPRGPHSRYRQPLPNCGYTRVPCGCGTGRFTTRPPAVICVLKCGRYPRGQRGGHGGKCRLSYRSGGGRQIAY